MPYTSPATVVTGTTIATAWGNSVKAALDFLANPPACRVHNSATQSCPDAAATALTFNSERYDTDTMHSTSTNTSRITIKTAGLYAVGGGFVLATRGDYFQVAAQLRLNGTTTIASNSLSGNGAQNVFGHVTVHINYKFAVNDYVELLVYQDNSANVAVNSEVAPNYGPEFYATWIGLG